MAADAASAGGAATHASTQSAIAVWHGAPSQSGQCWQGSVVAIGIAFSADADASAITGRPDARTARQPNRLARRCKHSILTIVRPSRRARQSTDCHYLTCCATTANMAMRRCGDSNGPQGIVCVDPVDDRTAHIRAGMSSLCDSNHRLCLPGSAGMGLSRRSRTHNNRRALA